MSTILLLQVVAELTLFSLEEAAEAAIELHFQAEQK